jgi:hypothetical protein
MYCHSVVVKYDVGLVEQLFVEHEVGLETMALWLVSKKLQQYSATGQAY